MRYLLVIAGLLAIVVGLFSKTPIVGTAWLQVGAISLAIGLATCEIVSAIGNAARRFDRGDPLNRFRHAVKTGNSRTMVDLLKDGGVPEDIAEQAARSILKDPGTVGM